MSGINHIEDATMPNIERLEVFASEEHEAYANIKYALRGIHPSIREKGCNIYDFGEHMMVEDYPDQKKVVIVASRKMHGESDAEREFLNYLGRVA